MNFYFKTEIKGPPEKNLYLIIWDSSFTFFVIDQFNCINPVRLAIFSLLASVSAVDLVKIKIADLMFVNGSADCNFVSSS